jgi:hypothetical protein
VADADDGDIARMLKEPARFAAFIVREINGSVVGFADYPVQLRSGQSSSTDSSSTYQRLAAKSRSAVSQHSSLLGGGRSPSIMR